MKRLANFLCIAAMSLFVMSCNSMDSTLDDYEEYVNECISIIEEAKEDGEEVDDLSDKYKSKLEDVIEKAGELGEELEKSELELTVAGTKDAINMVEAGAREASEDDMLEALLFGHEAIKKLIAFQEEIINELIGKMKRREIALSEKGNKISGPGNNKNYN